MTNYIEQTRRELAAAQSKMDALNRILQSESFPSGTVVRYQRDGEAVLTCAVKRRAEGEAWLATGRQNPVSWDILVASMLRNYKAPTHLSVCLPDEDVFTNLLLDPPPPVEVRQTDDSMFLTWQERTWEYVPTASGGNWVRVR